MSTLDPLYIFDLDGTLALIDHRRHFVEGEYKDWRAFYRACVRDEPNNAVVQVLMALWADGADIMIWSGRSDEVAQETRDWMENHLRSGSVEIVPEIRMRPAGDFTPDEQLKEQWLEELTTYDRRRLVAVFDDRDKVVQMWRRNGVPCFQVAPGAF